MPNEQVVDQDATIFRKQFSFNGEWFPDISPLKIGEINYSDVENVRFCGSDLVNVNGYSEINETHISTYIKGRNGIQIRTPFTVKSLVVVQQFNTGLTSSVLLTNSGTPPGTADFDAAVLMADTAGASVGMFTELFQSNIGYTNKKDMKVYGGTEQSVAAFFRASGVSGLTLTNGYDFTDRVTNILQDAANIVSLSTPNYTMVVATTRPIKAIKPYVKTANATAASISGAVWTGAAWTALTTVVDGTATAGATLAKTGIVSFDSTVSSAKPAYIEGMLLYFYTFTISAGSAEIYHITVDCPIQDFVDLWDGTYRTCITCQDSRSGVWEDYTAEVAEVSSAVYPIAAKWGGLTSSDSIIVMFASRVTALRLDFIASKVNAAASVITIKYWDGAAFTSVGTVYDGTVDSGGTKTFSQNGVIYWNSPGEAVEVKATKFNVHGFAYEITFSNTLTAGTGNDGVSVDTLTGVPAPRTMKARNFTFLYKNRLFLANFADNKENNRLDYGIPYAVDSFNGSLSSENGQHMYIGNSDDLVGAVNIYNRYGSNLYNTELLLKTSSTHLLDGEDPSSFKYYTVSDSIGCVSPRTISTAEIAYEVTQGAVRNISLWLSARGPMLFDAAILIPLKGVDLYFDQSKTTCINFQAIENSHAWFDPFYREWNLCIPSGTGQTICNVWLFYDLVHKRWFKKNVATASVPQATVKVVDVYGNTYIYGLLDNGTMVRLEDGLTWGAVAKVVSKITTGDILPTGSLTDITCLRRLHLVRENPGTSDLSYSITGAKAISYGIDPVTGDAYTYYGQKALENTLLTTVSWAGGGLQCAKIREKYTFTTPEWGLFSWDGIDWEEGFTGLYRETNGILDIVGELKEKTQFTIECSTADFVTAGFVAGLEVSTSDPDFPGPYIVESVTATKLVFVATTVVTHECKLIAGTLDVSAFFFGIEHSLDGSNTFTKLPVIINKTSDLYQWIISNCNKVGSTHKFRFTFNSIGSTIGIKPLLWGFQFSVERELIGG